MRGMAGLLLGRGGCWGEVVFRSELAGAVGRGVCGLDGEGGKCKARRASPVLRAPSAALSFEVPHWLHASRLAQFQLPQAHGQSPTDGSIDGGTPLALLRELQCIGLAMLPPYIGTTCAEVRSQAGFALSFELRYEF